VLPRAHPTQYTKWLLDRFSRFCTAHGRRSPHFKMGLPFPSQNCPSHGGIWTPSNTWFLGPTQVHNLKWHVDQFRGFCKAHNHDKSTDHATSVTTGRIYVHSTMMWPNNITTTTVLRPFFRDHLRQLVPENFWTLWCRGRLTDANTQTIRLGDTPSGLTSAHLHHPPIFYRPDALPAAQPTVSKH